MPDCACYWNQWVQTYTCGQESMHGLEVAGEERLVPSCFFNFFTLFMYLMYIMYTMVIGIFMGGFRVQTHNESVPVKA